MKRKMKKLCSTAIAVAVSFSVFGYGSSYNTKAEELIYDDNNISLTTAFDRYIATGTGELAQQLQIVVSEELAAEATSTDAQADMTPSGVITEVDLSTTGTIVELEAEPEDTEEATEETTEEATTEEVVVETTEEAPVESTTNENYSEFEGKAIITATGVINIRSDATASSNKVGTITTGGVVTVESKGAEWSVIKSGNVRGYIKNEFMAFDDAAGKYAQANPKVVAYDSAKEYTAPEPSTEAPSTEASTDTAAPAEQPEQSNVITTATAGYQPVVDYALQFVGNPYVYGGSSLTNGTDCSGFTMSVYANFGYSLPHSSAVQATRGTEVDLAAVSPGDLVFYKNGGKTIGHVALYIGNGQVVHASTSKTGIIVSNMYYSTPCKAVRIVN